MTTPLGVVKNYYIPNFKPVGYIQVDFDAAK